MLSKFDIMEQRDEEQILAEAQGNIIKEMFYKFPLDGKTVTGISWVGTKEIARRYGNIEMGLPQVTDLGDQYACNVQGTDTKNGLTLVGSSLQPKNMKLRNGQEKPDRFAYTKCVSKAQRNAIRALIPENFLLQMEKTFSKDPTKIDNTPPSATELRKQVESEYKVDVVPPGRPSKTSILEYFEQCGYESEMFTVWEDEPTGIVCFKPKRFIDDPGFRDQVHELGARYDKENKCYVVNM